MAVVVKVRAGSRTSRALVVALGFAVALALVPPALAGGDPAPFLVGAARASADPAPPYEGIWLGGYGSNRPMEEILHPLYARAIAITGQGGEGASVVLVTTTAAGLFAAYKAEWGEVGARAIRERIAERTGLEPEQVVVQSDHSHAAPDTVGLWNGVPVSYMELLRDAAVDAGVEAFTSREPADLSVAVVEGPPLRTLYDRPPTDVADLDFRVLFADSPDGHRVATLVSYSPHATLLGDTRGGASGDWPAIASQIIEDRGWGGGIGFIGAIGATDWEERDSGVKTEEEGRERINRFLDEAEANRRPVAGDVVAVESTFIRDAATQPILIGATLLPLVYRQETPPWLTGTVIGTVVSTARVGDLLLWSSPGEAFPQMQFRLREGIDAAVHFPIGSANDFLGYMTGDLDAHAQAFENGALWLGGCPDRPIRGLLGLEQECNDHWGLMASATIGVHVVCTAQEAAQRFGFTVDPDSRHAVCPALTATDQPEGDVLFLP